ncbi:MAG: DUF2089 family protein [Thermotogaceae bacterium]|nr:DUF2089 family protein [Thermotogaceae bacterium]
MLPRCPVCGKEMVVTELRCEEDEVTVRGRFTPSPFDFLDEEDMEFVILFFRAKGNLKELERYTKQGYFALRGKLERIIEKMGLEPLPKDGEEEEELENEDLFEMIKRGKVSIDDALNILKRKRR